MAFGETLGAEDSKAIHEILKDPLVTSIRFIDTGERAYDHTEAEFTRSDGTTFVLRQGDEKFDDVFEIVNELDLPWRFHDTFFVDLTMPQVFVVSQEVEVTSNQTVTAYSKAEAREIVENAAIDEGELDWSTASSRITSVEAHDTYATTGG